MRVDVRCRMSVEYDPHLLAALQAVQRAALDNHVVTCCVRSTTATAAAATDAVTRHQSPRHGLVRLGLEHVGHQTERRVLYLYAVEDDLNVVLHVALAVEADVKVALLALQ